MKKKSNTCIRVFADVNQIKQCKQDISSKANQFGNLSKVLGLAGNEVRFKIIYLLNKEGKMCPCDLSDILEMTVPAVSQHLKKLKEGGLIQDKKVAQTIFYSLSSDYKEIVNPLLSLLNSKSLQNV